MNGEGAAYQILCPAANKHANGGCLDGRKGQFLQHSVQGDIKVGDRIDHGAVQIEDDDTDIV